jgi:hypothetical protein
MGLLLMGLAVSSVGAQNGDEQRFPNGYVVKGEFLRFYRSAPDPELVFGNPINNEEMDGFGKRVQYFDRARFELVTTDKGPKVQLANLGSLLYEIKEVTEEVPAKSSTCRQFTAARNQKEHNVCYKFLQFYDANAGSTYFGLPITEAFYREGYVVQYFENARFEWRPNLPSDLQVGLADLGRQAMQKYTLNPVKYSSNLIDRKSGEAVNFQAKVFVSQALVAPSVGNTIFVVVQDPALAAVQGATVNLSLTYSNMKRNFPAVVTTKDGIARIEIPGLDLKPKQMVQVQANVEYNGKTISASSWFRIWY